MLYPLKFKAIYKEKIWGGKKIASLLNKPVGDLENCGESWELSGFDEEPIIVSNGFLAGNSLNELVEVYMGDLVGEKVFHKYGQVFPLLIKFIDAQEDLSVQVHPDDEMAKQLGEFNGKTEMWYVIQADENAKINIGFKRPVAKNELKKLIQENRLEEVLHYVPAESGDTFYIPAGKVHAIGKGVLLAEIQQLSDITYRLYDYNRKGADGKTRELHIKEALEAIDYKDNANSPVIYSPKKNTTVDLVKSPYFITHLIHFDKAVEKIYVSLDSFVLYICVEGSAAFCYDDHMESISVGECVLKPACIENAVLVPKGNCKLLEVYMP